MEKIVIIIFFILYLIFVGYCIISWYKLPKEERDRIEEENTNNGSDYW